MGCLSSIYVTEVVKALPLSFLNELPEDLKIEQAKYTHRQTFKPVLKEVVMATEMIKWLLDNEQVIQPNKKEMYVACVKSGITSACRFSKFG
jgi:hypothetical protein